jgi:hypothetical protein
LAGWRRAHEYDFEYDPNLERVTVTFDEATLAAIRGVAGHRGVSRFLQIAARERLARLKLLELVDDLDERYGPPSKELRDEVSADARRVFRR